MATPNITPERADLGLVSPEELAAPPSLIRANPGGNLHSSLSQPFKSGPGQFRLNPYRLSQTRPGQKTRKFYSGLRLCSSLVCRCPIASTGIKKFWNSTGCTCITATSTMWPASVQA
ncbi:hypothetical protein [Spirosoma aureum]|uniref:hypothetical protein n=1 Tax=Spirosoma aureum TaxID=2692134 RepID=UPI001E54CEE2|nr:hypothetical protein [Spirosoma aureum]